MMIIINSNNLVIRRNFLVKLGFTDEDNLKPLIVAQRQVGNMLIVILLP